jgi:hypothetical protein
MEKAMKPIRNHTYIIHYKGLEDYMSYTGRAVCVDDVTNEDGWYLFEIPNKDILYFAEEDIIEAL